MEPVRYKQRDWTDKDAVEEFLKTSRTGVIGISGSEYPYCVPVNYVFRNGVIYFHGLGSGKKIRLLLENTRVCFTVYEEIGTVKDRIPCHADTSYRSVMLFGNAERIVDYNESAEVLQAIVDKFMPGFYKTKISSQLTEKYRSSHDNKGVAVFKIVPVEQTAKVNEVRAEELFHR